MSIFIPFNNQPASTDQKDNASYTVPAAKYARVVISYTCVAYVSAWTTTSLVTGNALPILENPGKTGEFELWLETGAALTASTTNATGSIGSTSFKYSEITLSVDGTVVKRVRDYINGWLGYGNPTTLYDQITISGYTDYCIAAEEYNELSQESLC